MIGSVGSYNQFASHEGMEVPAGLCAAEGELTRLFGYELHLRNLVPVCINFPVIVFPSVLEVCNTLLFYKKFYRVPIQKESVGYIKGGWFQDKGISLVHHNPRRGVAELFCLQLDNVGTGLMGKETDG